MRALQGIRANGMAAHQNKFTHDGLDEILF